MDAVDFQCFYYCEEWIQEYPDCERAKAEGRCWLAYEKPYIEPCDSVEVKIP